MLGGRANLGSGWMLLAASVVLIFSASAARADETIYSNIPATSPYYNGGGLVADGTDLAWAMAFTPSGTYDLTELVLGIFYQGAGGAPQADPVTVTLNSDSSDTPGTVLESWSVTGLPNFDTSASTLDLLTTLTPTSTIQLTSGDQYWIDVIYAYPVVTGWYPNDTSATGTTWNGLNGTQNDQTNGAFEVEGVTPEPSAWLLYGTGFLAMLFAMRRRLGA